MDNIRPVDNSMEYIENYFRGPNDESAVEIFKKRVEDDPAFAEQVAFYISATGIIQQELQEEKKHRFRELYEQRTVVSIRQPIKTIWKYLAAASVLVAVVVFSWLLSGDKNSPERLADKYVRENLATLPVTMGTMDSVQLGLKLYNSKKLTEALALFENLAKGDSSNNLVIKYAGITSLRAGNYDKALQYFSTLENDTTSFSNPGKFYKAVTLMERNGKGDKDAAKSLLQQVIAGENTDGKNEATQWLNSF